MTKMGSPTFASCLLCLFILGLCSAQTVGAYNSSNFKPGTFIARPMCNAIRQLEMGCMREVSQDPSLSNCCRRCLYATGCIGASVDLGSLKCYLHSQCDFLFGCVIKNTDFNYMEKLAVSTTEIATEAAPETATEISTQMAPEMVTTMAPEMVTMMAPEMVKTMASETDAEIATEMVTEVAPEMTTTMANGMASWTVLQMAIEVTTEKTAEVTTEKTAEVTTEKTSEVTTEKTAEVTTEKTSEVTTEKTAEVTTEKTSEVTTETTAEVTTEKTAEVTTEKTSEVTTEKTAEVTTETTAEVTTDKTAEVTTEKTAEVTTETTAEVTIGMATEKTLEISFETTTELKTAGSLTCEQGVYDKQTGKCICNYGYSGQRCERNYYDCLEIKQFYPVYFYAHQYHCLPIKPQNHFSAFQMRCEVRNDEAVTYLMLNTGSVNFNRSWYEYTDYIVNLKVDGTYWMDHGSYWMGLEHMYIMLGPSGRTVYLEYFLYNYTNGENSVITHKYTDFRLGDRNTYFKLTYSSHEVFMMGKVNVTLSECPAISNMSKFSTLDLNNDDDPIRHCAETANAGGWFSICYNVSCNPLGSFYGQTPAPPTENGYVQIPGLDRAVVREQLQRVAMYYIE